jgi:hypothetical protein
MPRPPVYSPVEPKLLSASQARHAFLQKVKSDIVSVFNRPRYQADRGGQKVQFHACLNLAQDGGMW